MSSAAEIVSYITSKGWTVKDREKWAVVGWQLVLDCPLCGKTSDATQRRFYISEESGQWKTYCCQQDGNLITLQRRLGDLDVKLMSAASLLDERAKGLGQKLLQSRGGQGAITLVTEKHTLPASGLDDEYHAALLQRPQALAYLLVERGLAQATIDSAKLGFRPIDAGQAGKLGTMTDDPAHGWISIPWYLPDGALAGFKYRALPATEPVGRFKREKGSPTILYGCDRLTVKPASMVTLYEGEIDRLSGDQMGFPAGLASTGGAGTWQPEWTALLAGVDTILIAYDNDPAGEEGAEKVAEALGRWRCKRVRLPRHDANECLQPASPKNPKGPATADEIRESVFTSEPFKFQGLRNAGEYGGLATMSKAKAMGADPVVPGLKAVLGGLRGAEITILSGETGTGKTTFSTFWAWALASANYGPVMIASPEHQPEEEALKLATMEQGGAFLDLDEAGRLFILQRLIRKGVMLYDSFGQISAKSLFDTLRYFYRACGGKFAVVDHLQFFVAREGKQQMNEAIDAFLLDLDRLLKTELQGLHVVVVVHPNNDMEAGEKSKGNRRVTMFNLKGSSGIRQNVHNVAIIDRAARLDGRLRAYLRFDKVRSIFGAPGEIGFEFDADSLHYLDLQTAVARSQAAGAIPAPTPNPTVAPPVAPVPKSKRRKDVKMLAANDDTQTEDDDGK